MEKNTHNKKGNGPSHHHLQAGAHNKHAGAPFEHKQKHHIHPGANVSAHANSASFKIDEHKHPKKK